MLTPDQLQLVKQSVTEAQSILVFFAAPAPFDQAASAISIFLGLRDLQKNVHLLSPKAPASELEKLSGIDQVSSKIGNKNLQISFEYQEDMVDKVSYHIDEEDHKFHLIVQPKKNAQPLDASKVEFNYTGADADLIFLVGVNNLESLDELYYGYEDMFKDATTISVNSFDTDYGTIKLDTSGSPSFSEATAYILQEIGIEINGDIATNLLAGIEEQTNSFQSLSTTADTFEIVSKLLRSGARRINRQPVKVPAPAPNTVRQIPSSTNGFADAIARKTPRDVPNMTQNEKPKPKVKSPQMNETPRMEGGSLM